MHPPRWSTWTALWRAVHVSAAKLVLTMQGIRICAGRFPWVDATADPSSNKRKLSKCCFPRPVVVHPGVTSHPSLGVPWNWQCETYLSKNSPSHTFQWREAGLFYESVLLLKLSRLFPGVQSFDRHSKRDKRYPPKARETSLEITDK